MKCLKYLTFLLLVVGGVFVSAQEKILLVSWENSPYAGQNLSGNGYASEVTTEVFRRLGNRVDIRFFPLSRAMAMGKTNEADAVFPVIVDPVSVSDYALSDSFPGGQVGLLKRRDFPFEFKGAGKANTPEYFRALAKYSFGVVRGMLVTPEFATADFLKKDPATDDEQNLMKLYGRRVDFAIADKYVAADLMAFKLPHMIGCFEFVDPALAEFPFHVAFSRARPGYEKRVEAFNSELRKMTDDGTIAKIRYKHGLWTPKEVPGKKVIRIGSVNNSEMLAMQKLGSEYEKAHPDIKLEWLSLDEDTLRLRVLSDLAINDRKFDVVTVGTYEVPLWAKSGWLVPFKDIPASYDLNDVFESVRSGLSYNKELYALPFYAESTMTFYRKDLFAKAGLVMPEHPTYDDILKFATKLHDPKNGVYGIGLRGEAGWGGNMAFFTTLVNTFGGRWFDEKWRPVIDSAEWKAALTFYVDILSTYGHPKRVTNGWQANQQLFAEGQLAILLDATSFAGRLFNPKTSKVSDKIGTAPMPVARTPNGSHWLWAWSLAVPSSTRISKDALDFILWATSKEYIQLVGERNGWILTPPGTRQSTYKDARYRAEAPFADFVLDAIKTADPTRQTLLPVPYVGIQYVGIPEFPAIGTQVGLLVAEALAGKIPIGDALRKAQELTDKQMRLSGYYR